MNARKWFQLATASALVSAAAAVSAAPIQLTLVGPVTGAAQVGQTAGNPCIFGDASCNAGLLGVYTEFPTGGGTQTYMETQSYSIETIRGAVGNAFEIGVDVNTTAAAGETLDIFNVWLGGAGSGTLLYTYTGGANIATGIANGTGKSDWFLQSLNLGSVAALSQITFEVKVSGATNGREQFFLVDRGVEPCIPGTPNCNPGGEGELPLPGVAFLLAGGLVMLRRRFA